VLRIVATAITRLSRRLVAGRRDREPGTQRRETVLATERPEGEVAVELPRFVAILRQAERERGARLLDA